MTKRIVIVLFLAACGSRQPGSIGTPVSPATAGVEQAFKRVRGDSVRLHHFLLEMPKGGDLHSHLGGAVYAESFLRWAAEGGLCVSTATMTLVPPPCSDRGDKTPTAAAISADPQASAPVIDAWSMRNWDPKVRSGHDQFFDSFGKFGLASQGRLGDMLAEVTARAAAQQVSYLELMQSLDGGVAMALGRRVGWTTDFAALRDRLLAAGLADSLTRTMRDLTAGESRSRALMRCESKAPDAGCAVTVRYLYQVLRGRQPVEVFAQILTGFELAQRDGRVVGFNLVEPEDHAVPMGDFRLHMQMIDFLHRLYPAVQISLHAGELAEGLVPPEGLRFHIRESVSLGHAQRIGHGVDVLQEDSSAVLLQRMARQHILVEISLSSNSEILGVSGSRHPLATYLKAGVPVALATDDEGVSRSNMTHEYERAVVVQRLDYATLKQMARNSLVYSFAAPADKNRLLAQYDQAVNRFEAKWSVAPPH